MNYTDNVEIVNCLAIKLSEKKMNKIVHSLSFSLCKILGSTYETGAFVGQK